MHLHERGEPQGWFAVVAETEESRSVGNQSAMSGHSIDGRAHAKLAHTKINVAAFGVEMKAGALFKDRPGRTGQVGCAADQLGHSFEDGIHDIATGSAGCNRLIDREGRPVLAPASGESARLHALELRSQIRMLLLVAGE